MTPDRLAKIRAEFERLATAQGLNCDFLWDVADSCYAHQDTDDIFQGFLLAHTSSEMAKDAERFVAWFDYGDAEVCDRVQYAMMNRADDDVAAWREEIDNATAAIKEQTK